MPDPIPGTDDAGCMNLIERLLNYDPTTLSHWARRPKMESVLRAFVGGDDTAALEEAVRLYKSFPHEPLFAIEAARQFHTAGHSVESMRILRRVTAHVEDPMALGMLGFCHMEQSEFSQAAELFGRALRKNPADSFSRINMRTLKDGFRPAGKAKPARPAPAVSVVTSLPPHNLETSRRAVTSWLRYGFTVISVNTEAEYAAMKEYFPDIRFCIQEHTAKELTGRDHQYLDALLGVLAAESGEVCAVVNADIVLQGSAETWANIVAVAEREFVFGSRINVAAPEDRQGRIYTAGFDWFFFPRSFLRSVPRSQLVLGQPFWDYCFPAWAFARGLSLRYCYSPVALHVLHGQTWSNDSYSRFILHGLDLLVGPFMSLVSRHRGLHVKALSALSDAVWLGIREAASPLFCRDPLFTNYMAPIDPLFWQQHTATVLTVW